MVRRIEFTDTRSDSTDPFSPKPVAEQYCDGKTHVIKYNFPPTDIIVGEESAQLLHKYTNPELFKILESHDPETYVPSLHAVMAIRRYGALVYASSNDEFDIDGELGRVSGLPLHGNPELNTFLHGVYNAATTIFSKFGDSKLAELASIKDHSEAVDKISELRRTE